MLNKPTDRADLSPFSAQTQPPRIEKHNPTPAEEIYEWLQNKNSILSNYKGIYLVFILCCCYCNHKDSLCGG